MWSTNMSKSIIYKIRLNQQKDLLAFQYSNELKFARAMNKRFNIVGHQIFYHLILIIFFSLAFPVQSEEPDDQLELDPVHLVIQELFEKQNYFELLGEKIDSPDLVKQFYQLNAYHSVWSQEFQFSNQVKIWTKYLPDIEADGLDPKDYHLGLIQSTYDQIAHDDDKTFSSVAKFDLLLTDSFLTLAKHLTLGRVNPTTIFADWIFPQSRADLVTIFKEAIEHHRVVGALKNLFPSDPHYQKMKESLEYYKKLAQRGGWPKIPNSKKKMEVGYEGPGVVALRKRLWVTGELKGKPGTYFDLYDDRLADAVKKFQAKNGLNLDGVVGKNTLHALNQTVQDRVDQIKVNMERLRWLSKDFGKRYIFVNIPDYKAQIFENGKLSFEMKTVVGNRDWPTPVFNDVIEYVVVNPRWDVPENIAKKEMLPKIQEDSSYLNTSHFTVFKIVHEKYIKVDPNEIDWNEAKPEDYRFSQASGQTNSLGRLKFMFPNRFNVYLHDTPVRTLFTHDIRAYSHGCIRVEKPLILAEYLLRDREKTWDMQRIMTEIDSGITRTVPLPEKVPIYLYYVTAWVDDEGVMQFRKDIYGYDKKMAQML